MKKLLIMILSLMFIMVLSFEASSQPVVLDPTLQLSEYAQITDPFHLSFDSLGNLFAGRDNSGSGGSSGDAVKIHKISPDGTTVQEFGNLIVDPDGVVVDMLGTITGVPDTILIAGIGSGGSITKISPDGLTTQLLVAHSALNNPQQLAFQSNGDLLWANCGNGTVGKIPAGTLSPSIFANSGSTTCLGGTAVDSSDSIYASVWADAGKIIKFNADGSIANANFVTGLSRPDAMTYDHVGKLGGKLFVVERGNGQIQSIDPDTGTNQIFATGFNSPFGLAVGHDGCLYVSEFGEDKIWQICPPVIKKDLCAGQSIDVGTVTVWSDADNLYVEYSTEGGWIITETHLDVGYIYVNKSGNPVPGKFGYSDPHGSVTEHTYTIPLSGLLGCQYDIAAHAVVVSAVEGCSELVWQIGDIEGVDPITLQLYNYADEFNWAYPAGPITAGPTLAQDTPAFTSPFIVGTTPTSEFPYNSNTVRGYATDFDVQWDGTLLFGGVLTVSWSPGASAAEKKEISGDGIPSIIFTATGANTPGMGWFLNKYPLVEQSTSVAPLSYGTHTINFQHTQGDGTFWDWIWLEKPCEQWETAWGDGCEGARITEKGNWATYFTYTLPSCE